MGFKCDVCQHGEAAVFCFADSAVMCTACDCRVHGANKLVRKHERVALNPVKNTVQCDICQEEKAVMFCSEDRALICRQCDIMIHTANELTAKHQRYLLSGLAPGLVALATPGATASSDSNQAGTSGRGAQSSGRASRDAARGLSKAGSLGQLINGGTSLAGAGDEGGMLLQPNGHSGLHSSLANQHQPSGLLARSDPGDAASGSMQHVSAGSGGGASGSRAAAAGQSAAERDQFESGMTRYASSSSGMTLAAELLGMPTLNDHYSAKDIDAAWFADTAFDDLDGDLSSILAVPDLEFGAADSPPLPSGTYLRPNGLLSSHGLDGPGSHLNPLGRGLGEDGAHSLLLQSCAGGGDSTPGGSGIGDGVVPDLSEHASKRQRVA